jgi:hypothetical protein
VEAYLELGLIDEAQRHAAILGHNYPDSDWYEDTYRIFRRHGQELREVQARNKRQDDGNQHELSPEERLRLAGDDVDLSKAPEIRESGASDTDITPDIPGAPTN